MLLRWIGVSPSPGPQPRPRRDLLADLDRQSRCRPWALAALAAVALCLPACSTEPAFLQACADECDCTQEGFACSDQCDNSYRREWVLAAQESAACKATYEEYFLCILEESICGEESGFPVYGPPEGACDDLYAAYSGC
jgi:hypothetical protein